MKTAEIVQVKKGKSVIKFDNSKRVEYVTGFQKRAKERKEQARKYHEAKLKKAKLEARAMRRKVADELMSRYEREKQAAEAGSSDSESDPEPQPYVDPLASRAPQTTVRQVGAATVEVSELSLRSDLFQGANVDFDTCKLKSTSVLKRGNLSKKNLNAPKQFNEAVKGAMKTLKRKTSKLTGVGKKNKKGGKKSSKVTKSKKEHLVTHL